AAIRGFHEAGPAARHHGKPQLAHAPADLATHRVVRMIVLEPRGAEDRHTGSHEMQGPKAADEVSDAAKHQPEFLKAGMGPLEEHAVSWRGHVMLIYGNPHATGTPSRGNIPATFSAAGGGRRGAIGKIPRRRERLRT